MEEVGLGPLSITPKRGDPCWEDDCTAGVAFRLTGPPTQMLLPGGIKATLQATIFLCPTHTIIHSVKDPALIIEEL